MCRTGFYSPRKFYIVGAIAENPHDTVVSAIKISLRTSEMAQEKKEPPAARKAGDLSFSLGINSYDYREN